jgi:hypothetical protein
MSSTGSTELSACSESADARLVGVASLATLVRRLALARQRNVRDGERLERAALGDQLELDALKVVHLEEVGQPLRVGEHVAGCRRGP